MSKQDEFRQYAEECLASARTARDEFAREQFFDLARMWMTAAQQLDDDIVIPIPAERSPMNRAIFS